jgi:hypothetical protein
MWGTGRAECGGPAGSGTRGVWVHPACAKNLEGVREMLAPPEHLRFGAWSPTTWASMRRT